MQASIHKDIRSGAVDLDALSQLKADLHLRSASQVRGQEEVLSGIGRAMRGSAEQSYEPQNQAEMNRYAFHLANLAEQEMDFVVDELMGHLSASEEKVFRKAQKAWKVYAAAQAEFESLEAEGGSMQSMLQSAALRVLIVQRAGLIKSEVNRRNQIESDIESVENE